MNCRSARRLIPLHAGGDLERDRALKLEAHLATCSACGEELRAHRGIQELLASVREPVTPFPGLWEELDGRLDAVDAARQLRRPWTRNPWLYAAAAAVLLLAFLPWVPRVGGSDLPVHESARFARADSATPSAQEGLHAVPSGQLRDFLGRSGALLLRRRGPSNPDGGPLVVPVVSTRRDF